jgi:hypothetical protein
MITNLTEGKIQTRLIISVGVAAIIVMGIGSHAAFAVKVKKNSFQDRYNAGFATGKKIGYVMIMNLTVNLLRVIQMHMMKVIDVDMMMRGLEENILVLILQL